MALPQQTHAQFSTCKIIMQKCAAPSCQELLIGHPKKEKSKLPQASCSKAAVVPMPLRGCHRARSLPRPECCTDGKAAAAFGIPQPQELLQHGEHTPPGQHTVPLRQCFHLDSVLLSQYKIDIFIFTFGKRHKVTVLVCFSPNWGALISRGEEGLASCTILQHQRCGAAGEEP